MRVKLAALLLSGVAAAWAQNPGAPNDLLAEVSKRPTMRLEQFQQLASARNPTLREAKALVDASGAQARQAGLFPNPTVGYQGEQIRGGSYGGGEQGGFVQQTFPLGGKLGLRRGAYEERRRTDEVSLSEQRYRVSSDIAQNFYAALAAQEMVAVRKRLVALANDAVATVHQLANGGQADAPDVLQTEVEGEEAELDYVTAQRGFLQAFSSLAALAGAPELAVSPLEGDFEHPLQVDGDRVLDQVLRDSPSLKRAEQEVALAQAELKSAQRENVPDLQIHAGLQQNNESLNTAAQTHVGLQSFVTAGVTLPIFDRNQGNIAAAKAEVERATAEVTRSRLLLKRNIEPVLQNYLTARTQAARYRDEIIPRSARAYRLYLAKYQEMAAAYPQVLVSQRTYFQLQIDYVRALETVWKTAMVLENYGLSAGLDAPGMTANPVSRF